MGSTCTALRSSAKTVRRCLLAAGLTVLSAAISLGASGCSLSASPSACGGSRAARSKQLHSIERLGALKTLLVTASDSPRLPRYQRWGIQRQSAFDDPPWSMMTPTSQDECANTLIAVPVSATDSTKELLVAAMAFSDAAAADRSIRDEVLIRRYAVTARRTGLATPLVGLQRRSEGNYYCKVGSVPRCSSWALVSKVGPRIVLEAAIYERRLSFSAARLRLLQVRAAGIQLLAARPGSVT